jgi:hypothetical protein
MLLDEVESYAYIISGMTKRKPAFGGLSMSSGELLEAALFGLEQRRNSINEKMAALRERLGIRGRGARVSSVADMVSPDGTAPPRKRRRMSAAGRRRIAAAMRKRWAALKQGPAAKAAPAKAAPARKKHKISAAGMKRIVAATKKRWAAFHAKKRAAGKKKSAA